MSSNAKSLASPLHAVLMGIDDVTGRVSELARDAAGRVKPDEPSGGLAALARKMRESGGVDENWVSDMESLEDWFNRPMPVDDC